MTTTDPIFATGRIVSRTRGTALLAIATLAAALLSGTPASAQAPSEGARHTPNTLKLAEGQVGQPATLRDVAWLAGAWIGEGLGGVSEEHWTAPAGGAMLGMYRVIRDGKPMLYELLTITEDKGSLVLKLKHFNADLTGWEDKDGMTRFPLVRVTKDQAFFSGLTFTRVDDTHSTIHLAIRGKDGVLREEIFTHARVTR